MKIEEEILQPKFTSPNQKAVVNLMFTAGWLASKHQDFFKAYGITSQQYNILRILRGQYPQAISATEIKARMLDKNSDVSRLLDRLIAKNMIEKKASQSDKRASDVFITQAGLDLLSAIQLRQEELEGIMVLTPDEATQLSDLLDKCRG
jgi:DNA-binding MarR family transcriptional regulator